MKKMLLSLLVLAGLQSNAQFFPPSSTPCDSLLIVGSQLNLTTEPIYDTLEFEVNHIWWFSSPDVYPLDASSLAEDSCYGGDLCVLDIYNYNDSTGLPYDTLYIILGYIDTADNYNFCVSSMTWNGVSFIQDNYDGDQTQSPTGIENINPIYDNKIYDIMGRELLEIPSNMMYIKNYQLHIVK